MLLFLLNKIIFPCCTKVLQCMHFITYTYFILYCNGIWIKSLILQNEEAVDVRCYFLMYLCNFLHLLWINANDLFVIYKHSSLFVFFDIPLRKTALETMLVRILLSKWPLYFAILLTFCAQLLHCWCCSTTGWL